MVMNALKDPDLAPDVIAKLESNAPQYWDAFYRSHSDRFFKDRHWFADEFPRLLRAHRVLEVGCGTGSTIYPLLALNPSAHIYACDFAETAVHLVVSNPIFSESRVTAFVADIVDQHLHQWIPPSTIDACTMVFILSAISPGWKMMAALANVSQALMPGTGCIFFRDYSCGDLAHCRRQAVGKQQKISEGFYARGDGTLAFYFSEENAKRLFEAAGFRCERLETVSRTKTNRKTGLSMERKFIQGTFVLEDPRKACEAAKQAKLAAMAAEGMENTGIRGHGGPTTEAKEELGKMEKEVDLTLGPLKLQLKLPPTLDSSSYSGLGSVGIKSSSVVLARIVLACPKLFSNRVVCEVSCGTTGLPSLAALRWCKRAIATDTSPLEISFFRRNAELNCHRFVCERLRICSPGKELDGQADTVLAAMQRSTITDTSLTKGKEYIAGVDDMLGIASRMLSHKHGAFVLVCLEDGDDLVELAALRHGLTVCPPPVQLQDALRVVEMYGNVVRYLEMCEGGLGSCSE